MRWLFSIIYRFAIWFRFSLYKYGILKRYRPAIPVISVGGIEVGGSGKTPSVIYIIGLLQKFGYTPILLTRGYGRKDRGRVIVHGRIENEDISVYGDEPFMINQKTSCPMIIHKDRRQSSKIGSGFNLEKPIFVLDDGFQHIRLGRDIDIVVISGGKPLFDRKFLPYKGDNGFADALRDSPHRLDEADFVFCKKASIPDVGDFTDAGSFVFGYKIKIHDEFDSVYLLSAIANNSDFRNSIEAEGIDVIKHFEFRDHHNFTDREIKAILFEISEMDDILTTEKDYYRIPAKYRSRFKIVQIEIDFADENAFVEEFREKLKRIEAASR